VTRAVKSGERRYARAARLYFYSGLVLSILATKAFGDAPTHKLMLEAETLSKTDCGNGECRPACSVKATLTNVGRGKSVSLEVAIWYNNNSTDAGQSAISLNFPDLAEQQTESATDEARGYNCYQVSVKRIEVSCPEELGKKCPVFYNISVPDFSPLGIKREDVEGK